MKVISLNHEGYWREVNFSGIPYYSGIYVFQECKYNPITKSVELKEILYIGQAENCNDRIINHEKLNEMKKYISYGNDLCVNVAKVSEPDKSRAEAALVYKHKPRFNDKLKDYFSYGSTTIYNSGRYELLVPSFTVG